jgi:diguanylate cyclase (GGDEF)-like protein
MNHNTIEGFFVIIDETYKIQKFYQTAAVEFLKENESLDHFVVTSHQKALFNFLDEINKNQVSFNHHIIMKNKNENTVFFLNGYKAHSHIFVCGIQDQDQVEEILEDLISFNNANINELRLLRKQIQLNDSGVYNEITKLNNELLNSRRLIEKQNAQLKRYNDLLKKSAIIDSLTGAYNRRHFYDIFKEEIIPGHQYKHLCLITIDFNDFKLVNDTFGHDAGDKILVDFVNISKEIINGVGNVFRIGGDEFTLLFYDQTKEQAYSYMEKIKEEFHIISPIAKIAYGSVKFSTAKLTHEYQLSKYIKKADEEMYKNKAEMKKNKKALF